MILDDNFLTENEIKQLQDILYLDRNSKFPWYFSQQFNLQSNGLNFEHIGMSNGENFSPFADEGNKILEKFCLKNNITIKKILNVNASLLTMDDTLENYSLSETEFNEPHLIFMYYVNDSDGETLLFNERYSSWGKFDKDTIHTAGKISPQAGRAVVFDNLQHYAECPPKSNNFKCKIVIHFLGKIN